jgi:DNA mismatch repair protein MLH3
MSQTCTAQKPSSCILPLPDDVVAQIKSSTAIVSLTDVVLELVKNSLDARATKVEASVDFARGACTVEDNGLGIPPLEFTEDGGLGRRYCTSSGCLIHVPARPMH